MLFRSGSISLRKGSFYILKAFCDLNLPNSELLMIGSVDLEIKNIVEKYKINRKIKFIKHVQQNKLIDYYNNSDVFIIASIEDGFAMVILQALACGLPVICTQNSGGSELIKNGENGYIVGIRDVEDIKRKMLLLYNDKKKLCNLKKNVISNRKEISWDDYGNRVVQNLKKLSI